MEHTKDNITLKELIQLHQAAGVMFVKPSTWDIFDIPEELLIAWKKFIKERNEYDKILKKYNFNL